MKELAKTLSDANRAVSEGIQAVEDGIKELNLGIELSIKVPFEGRLSYSKQNGHWRLYFDNSEFNHAEKNQLLINCSSAIRTKAAQYLPSLLQQASSATHEALKEREKAKQAIRVTLQALQDKKDGVPTPLLT